MKNLYEVNGTVRLVFHINDKIEADTEDEAMETAVQDLLSYLNYMLPEYDDDYLEAKLLHSREERIAIELAKPLNGQMTFDEVF